MSRRSPLRRLLPSLLALAVAVSCRGAPVVSEILLTSEAGARLAPQPPVPFTADAPTGAVLTVWPDSTRQAIHGIGSSFTESSAFVLAHLPPGKRREVMLRLWGREGADFSLARMHLGSCDFSVEGKYSYAEKPGDLALDAFSIAPDSAGFDPAAHPGVREPGYDLLPMIREAQAIKRGQGGVLRVIASAWTAPPWMKDTGEWFIPGSAANGWRGTGGALKPGYEAVYADYLVHALDAYAVAGVDLWGLTPVNEPHGNGGSWESMRFTPESQNDFIRLHLGPALARGGHGDVRLYVYDQNRDGLEAWTDVIFADPRTAPFVTGAAVHWYDSTVEVSEDVFDRVRAKFPGMEIIHSEGCIDNLGVAAPGGVADPEGYRESGWFLNDAFWWNANATDWGYSVTWEGVDPADHPKYVPVHRYARDVIVGLDHGLSGWVDWNSVLDRRGGPNHVGNFCGAPVMIDTDTGAVHWTPVYWVLAQLSRSIRPGDRALRTRLNPGGEAADGLHACATLGPGGEVAVQVLNTGAAPRALALRIDGRAARIEAPANSLQTVRVRR